MSDIISIPVEKMKQVFFTVLVKYGFEKQKADECAEIFTINSVDGVYSHSVNRFVSFIKLVENGFIIPNNDPEKVSGMNALEQWDGKLGVGVLNAVKATDRAMQLASN